MVCSSYLTKTKNPAHLHRAQDFSGRKNKLFKERLQWQFVMNITKNCR